MERIIDLLEKVLVCIADNGTHILDKELIMRIFSDLYQQLPPFLEYYTHTHKERATYLVDKIKGKVVSLASLSKKLLSPDLECNQDTHEMTAKLGSIADIALLVELRDERKVTVDYLTSCDDKYTWNGTLAIIHEAGFQKVATNDPAERSFGGTTHQLQYFGRIGFTGTGGVDQNEKEWGFITCFL